MVMFLANKLEEGELSFSADTLEVLDLGTGNGQLLFSLSEELDEIETKYEMMGIDYSADSVQLAQEVGKNQYSGLPISFKQVDLFADEEFFTNKFHIILDKGTLDAIALNQEPLPEFEDRIGMDVYASRVEKLMNTGSVLLITSCNFTEEELIRIITTNSLLTVWDKIKYPSFEFGGVKGSTVCSVAFTK